MPRYLLCTLEGSGNANPEIGLAQALIAQGDEVIIASYEMQRPRIEAYKLPFVSYPTASPAYLSQPADAIMTFPTIIRYVMAAEEHINDLPALMTETKADRLIIDCLLMGVLVAAQLKSLPATVFIHSTPNALAPPGQMFDMMLLPPTNAIRTKHGLPTIANLQEQWTAPNFRPIVSSIPELDPAPADVPPQIKFIGQLFDSCPPSAWKAPFPADDHRPLILVSFSAGPLWDQSSRIKRSVEAIGTRQQYRAVVTSSFADTSDIAAPSNVVIVKSIPHAEIIGNASLVICHGGHGTTTMALSYYQTWLISRYSEASLKNAARDVYSTEKMRAHRKSVRRLTKFSPNRHSNKKQLISRAYSRITRQNVNSTSKNTLTHDCTNVLRYMMRNCWYCSRN